MESFKLMPNRQLIVIGDGPDFEKIKSHAGKNVTLLGYQPYEVLVDYMQKAKAFIFAAEEDFGIAPIEAQACGVPVIAFGKGGALETIIGNYSSQNEVAKSDTGVFFEKQTVEELIKAIEVFEKNQDKFDKETIRNQALKFDTKRFELEFKTTIDTIIKNHKF